RGILHSTTVPLLDFCKSELMDIRLRLRAITDRRLKGRIVRNNKHPVLRDVHVEFKNVNARVDRVPECGNRILGSPRPRAAMPLNLNTRSRSLGCEQTQNRESKSDPHESRFYRETLTTG